jgi:hypothetical protein
VGPSEQSVEFFPRRGGVSSHRCFSRPSPPPPHQAWLLSLRPPLSSPPPSSSVVSEAGKSLYPGLRQGRALYKRVTYQICQGPLTYMEGQSRERMRSGPRRQEMTHSGSSPSRPRPPVPLTEGRRQMGGWGGGVWLGSPRGLFTCPISTTEKTAAYTRPLGCDLNSKFFSCIIE